MVRPKYVFIASLAVLTFAMAATAQQPAPPPDQASQPAAPAPLPTPSITGPLAGLPPAVFDAGLFGKISVNGFLSGMGLLTANTSPGDTSRQADLANGQIIVQKTDGWFQFYFQAGAYNLTSLGVGFAPTGSTMTNLYGPVPVGYVKLQAGKNTSFLVGSLPTLIGAEYTFTFQNMNIERGLLWNQEPAISRGVQVNQTMGKFTLSGSWNDGYYSNRYNWVSGSLAYTSGPHTLAFVGGGNLGSTGYQTFATPVQNNSNIYNVIYTYNKDGWIFQPYWQYTSVPTNLRAGVAQGADTKGYAALVNKTFKNGMSLPLRFEYISGTGGKNVQNLLYGAGSVAESMTITPTYQKGGFFVRGEASYVHLNKAASGAGFNAVGTGHDQERIMAEVGFVFGNNIVEDKPKK